jgi:succinate dehydrogenase/fumarate reductase cytochrome b subunit
MIEIVIWILVIVVFGSYFVGIYHILQEKDRIGYRKLIDDHQKRLDSDIKL